MNKTVIIFASAVFLLFCAAPAGAHDVVSSNGKPVSTHQHVWRQQHYGSDYRQGHSVNNAQGSITIWSPNTYAGYNAGSSVRFARPSPISKKSKISDHAPKLKTATGSTYGKSKTRGSGQ